MVIVLVATRYQTIVNWIMETKCKEIASIGIMKRNGPKVYLYVDTQLEYDKVYHLFKGIINKQSGSMLVYEIYAIYNGMIDYNFYLSSQTKQSMKYYQSAYKDITNEEIERYQKAHLTQALS